MAQPGLAGVRGASGEAGLGAAAAELYADRQLPAVLGQLLRHSRQCVGASAGSISLVDLAADRYAKLAEYGASCRLGQTFPLAEGVTGQVVARRAPVVLASYRDVRSGHLPAADPASRGAVAAVPIWWRGDVIGANVAFAGGGPGFSADQVDQLEFLTQVAATAIVRARTEPVVAPSVAPSMGDRSLHPGGPSLRPLTPREHQVLRLLALGLGDREVADRLVISPKTVEKHVASLLRKTGTGRRTAAVMRALELGWLSLGSLSVDT